MSNPHSPNLEAALAHVRGGRPVFPCGQERRPAVPRSAGGNGFHDATLDESTVRGWWATYRRSLIGMPTGAAVWGGVFVLDVDVKKGAPGMETVAALCGVFGALPPTVEAITGSGGRHLYFRHPLDGRMVPNKQSRLGLGSETWGADGYPEVPFERAPNGQIITPGLDVRGDGGYVILPGSQLAAGGGYTWAPGRDPESCPIATAPPWLLALVAVDPQAAPVPRATAGGDRRERPAAAASSFFAKVNTKALGALGAWVPVLLPGARPYREGYRCTSKALGRDLEEDLSIIPAGIQDWGEERGKTPIDLVLEWGAPTTSADAALWLCRQIGIDPTLLGWRQTRPPGSSSRPPGPPPCTEQVDEGPRAADPSPPEPPNAAPEQKGSGGAAPPRPPPNDGSGGPPGRRDRPPWADRLMYTERGGLQATAFNVRVILENVKEWQGVLAWCEFSQRIVLRKPLPFADASREEWTNAHDGELQYWLAERFRIEPQLPKVATAVMGVALLHRVHPVREYLDSLIWDGRPRLASWLVTLMGAGARDDLALTDSQRVALDRYLMWVGTWWLIQSVARIRSPGCKADTVLILEGEQGIKKSSALRTLYGEAFTSDTRIDFSNKDAMQSMGGAWVIELPELEGMNKADARTLKAFLSSPVDRFRLPYGHRLDSFPRQSVMAGTTNQAEIFRDLTGNRRYWPVACGEIDLEGLHAERDQLWAEAGVRYAQGERWWAESDDEKAIVEEQQGDRVAGDVWEGRIQQFLAGRLAACRTAQERMCTFVALDSIMGSGLGFELKDMKPQDWTRAGMLIHALGWRATRPTVAGQRVRGYRPGPKVLAAWADAAVQVRPMEDDDVPQF
jgi:predicted P-loop ATPase